MSQAAWHYKQHKDDDSLLKVLELTERYLNQKIWSVYRSLRINTWFGSTEVEDVQQEAVLFIIEAIDRWDGETSSFFTYLYGSFLSKNLYGAIAKGRLLRLPYTCVRDGDTEKFMEAGRELIPIIYDDNDCFFDSRSNPTAEVESKELYEIIQREVKEFPLLKKRAEGYTHGEIGKMNGYSNQRSHQLVSKGLKKARKIIDEG